MRVNIILLCQLLLLFLQGCDSQYLVLCAFTSDQEYHIEVLANNNSFEFIQQISRGKCIPFTIPALSTTLSIKVDSLPILLREHSEIIVMHELYVPKKMSIQRNFITIPIYNFEYNVINTYFLSVFDKKYSLMIDGIRRQPNEGHPISPGTHHLSLSQEGNYYYNGWVPIRNRFYLDAADEYINLDSSPHPFFLVDISALRAISLLELNLFNKKSAQYYLILTITYLCKGVSDPSLAQQQVELTNFANENLIYYTFLDTEDIDQSSLSIHVSIMSLEARRHSLFPYLNDFVEATNPIKEKIRTIIQELIPSSKLIDGPINEMNNVYIFILKGKSKWKHKGLKLHSNESVFYSSRAANCKEQIKVCLYLSPPALEYDLVHDVRLLDTVKNFLFMPSKFSLKNRRISLNSETPFFVSPEFAGTLFINTPTVINSVSVGTNEKPPVLLKESLGYIMAFFRMKKISVASSSFVQFLESLIAIHAKKNKKHYYYPYVIFFELLLMRKRAGKILRFTGEEKDLITSFPQIPLDPTDSLGIFSGGGNNRNDGTHEINSPQGLELLSPEHVLGNEDSAEGSSEGDAMFHLFDEGQEDKEFPKIPESASSTQNNNNGGGLVGQTVSAKESWETNSDNTHGGQNNDGLNSLLTREESLALRIYKSDEPEKSKYQEPIELNKKRSTKTRQKKLQHPYGRQKELLANIEHYLNASFTSNAGLTYFTPRSNATGEIRLVYVNGDGKTFSVRSLTIHELVCSNNLFEPEFLAFPPSMDSLKKSDDTVMNVGLSESVHFSPLATTQSKCPRTAPTKAQSSTKAIETKKPSQREYPSDHEVAMETPVFLQPVMNEQEKIIKKKKSLLNNIVQQEDLAAESSFVEKSENIPEEETSMRSRNSIKIKEELDDWIDIPEVESLSGETDNEGTEIINQTSNNVDEAAHNAEHSIHNCLDQGAIEIPMLNDATMQDYNNSEQVTSQTRIGVPERASSPQSTEIGNDLKSMTTLHKNKTLPKRINEGELVVSFKAKNLKMMNSMITEKEKMKRNKGMCMSILLDEVLNMQVIRLYELYNSSEYSYDEKKNVEDISFFKKQSKIGRSILILRSAVIFYVLYKFLKYIVLLLYHRLYLSKEFLDDLSKES